MIRYLSVAALVVAGATLAYAQGAATGPIADRKAAMKGIGGANKSLGDMAKGDVPFDAAKVAAAYKTMEDNFTKAKSLFPDNAKTGGDTQALPAIWEKKADFMARLDKAAADAKKTAASVKDLASLKTNHGEFAKGTCGGCHKDYRQPPKK